MQSNNTIEIFNAALAIIGAMKGTFQIKTSHELGVASLKFRICFRPFAFSKIEINQISKYLYELIPSETSIYNTHSTGNVETYYYRTCLFKYFPLWSIIAEWDKLNINFRYQFTQYQIFPYI